MTWINQLLDHYASISLGEVFGSLASAPIGSGRAKFILPQIDKKKAKQHVEYAHSKNISFNFVANGSCLGNMEYKRTSHERILEQLTWIDSIGVDSVTVTIPYLARIIKEKFRRFRVKTSVIAQVNSVQRARAWQNLGVDEINIDYMCNRNFKMLKAIQKAVTVDLCLLVNDQCLFHCPYRQYHYNLMAHTTQEGHELEGAYFDYCMISCTIDKYTRPQELVRCRWIRPEDLKKYEVLGFSRFKLSGRNMSTKWLKRMSTSYNQRFYHGNLADILAGTAFDAEGTVYYHIDNDALGKFLDYFTSRDCSMECDNCNWCKSIAEQVVTFDQKKAKQFVGTCKSLLKGLTSGTVFTYLGDRQA